MAANILKKLKLEQENASGEKQPICSEPHYVWLT